MTGGPVDQSGLCYLRNWYTHNSERTTTIMATTGGELVGWQEKRWTAVQKAVNRAMARTAKCRQVIPKGPEMIGATTLTSAKVSGAPLELTDEVTAPVALSVTVQFDDQHSGDEPAILRLLESAAADLGKLED